MRATAVSLATGNRRSMSCNCTKVVVRPFNSCQYQRRPTGIGYTGFSTAQEASTSKSRSRALTRLRADCWSSVSCGLYVESKHNDLRSWLQAPADTSHFPACSPQPLPLHSNLQRWSNCEGLAFSRTSRQLTCHTMIESYCFKPCATASLPR